MRMRYDFEILEVGIGLDGGSKGRYVEMQMREIELVLGELDDSKRVAQT